MSTASAKTARAAGQEARLQYSVAASRPAGPRPHHSQSRIARPGWNRLAQCRSPCTTSHRTVPRLTSMPNCQSRSVSWLASTHSRWVEVVARTSSDWRRSNHQRPGTWSPAARTSVGEHGRPANPCHNLGSYFARTFFPFGHVKHDWLGDPTDVLCGPHPCPIVVVARLRGTATVDHRCYCAWSFMVNA